MVYIKKKKYMNKEILVRKANGEEEPFSRAKFEHSLKRSGAGEKEVEIIVADIIGWLTSGISTRKIYGRAFSLLKNMKSGFAARYKLKKALEELGPTGYPFEHFIGQIFKEKGYKIKVGEIINGNCITHEIDVIAEKNKTQNFMECKFYNSPGKYANVQVSLYFRSRMNDIINKRKSMPEYNGYNFEGWIVTNTRFTSDALAFGNCSGLKLLSWDYPSKNSLKDIIEQLKVFPITTLTGISKREKQRLMEGGIILCRQIRENNKILASFGISKAKQKKVIEELKELF